ncbi:MAG: PTS glucose transporter subunit IIA [Mediterraneibacter gnavus]
MLGFGCGIQPTSEMVYAPFDGAIVQVSDTKHAVGLRSADGTEVLIHVGMDTVEMNGNGFTTFVKTGDNVKKGEKLIEFSISEIEAAGYSSVTAVVVCSVSEAEKIKVLKADEIQTGEALLKVE